ncbi:MAG: 4Fe-4S binding protein [Desulfocapsaceae bacterium]|nr:4Fe-4S binding protein [Desulfocapsaceae bacterium]
MGVLSFLTTIFAPAGSQVGVNPRRCLRNRLRGNRCNLCLMICPTAALTYSNGSLHLNEEACSNCMACTAVCPVDALAPTGDLQQFVNEVKNVEHTFLIISCARNRLFHKNELLLPCLGVFSHELLVSVASAVTQKRILFNSRGCGGCRNEKVFYWFKGNLTSLLQNSDAKAVPKMEIVTADSDTRAQDDRRSFFKAMQRNAVNVTTSSRNAGKQAKQKMATSRTTSSKTGLLRKVLNADEPSHPLANRMVPRLSIDENCSPCPRCAGICPTGALKLARLEQRGKLMFEGNSCCSCGLCLDFCKEKALTLNCSLTD